MKCVKGLATSLLLYCQQWNLWEMGPRGRKLGCSDMLLKRHWDPVLFLSRGFIALLKQCPQPRAFTVMFFLVQGPEITESRCHRDKPLKL